MTHDGGGSPDRGAGRSPDPATDPGLLLADPRFTSEGILDAPPYLEGLVAGTTRPAGCSWPTRCSAASAAAARAVAVRTQGDHPDLVTLGKPMGAGYPSGR